MAWTQRARQFFKDVQSELAKVSWPTRSELRDSTGVVIATVIIVAVFVGVVDRILNTAVAMLFR